MNFPFSIFDSQFRGRSGELERLDTGDYTPEEYEQWLGDMRRVHGFFGEIRALKKTLLREISQSGKSRVAILDVGAGTGDLLGETLKAIGGERAFCVGVDLSLESARSIRAFGSSAVQSDAVLLPFADDSFDHAFCTLILHHLTDEDAAKLLAEMARVSRGRIFAVDLNRDIKAYYAYKAVAPIFLHQLTVDDGMLSILRSRTPAELLELAEIGGLEDVEIAHSRLNRLVLSGVRRK